MAKAKVRHDKPHRDHGRDGALHPFQELLSTSGSSDAPRWSEHLLWVSYILLLWRFVLLLHLAVVNFAFCRGLEDCLDLYFFHVDLIGAISHWHSESGPLAENTPLTSVSNRLKDRAARSPFHCGVGHLKVRARANASRCVRRLEVAVRRSAGALAATRQQSYGCAYRDVRWGSTCTTFHIITLLLLTPATEGVEMFMRLGVYVSFWLPKLRSNKTESDTIINLDHHH